MQELYSAYTNGWAVDSDCFLTNRHAIHQRFQNLICDSNYQLLEKPAFKPYTLLPTNLDLTKGERRLCSQWSPYTQIHALTARELKEMCARRQIRVKNSKATKEVYAGLLIKWVSLARPSPVVTRRLTIVPQRDEYLTTPDLESNVECYLKLKNSGPVFGSNMLGLYRSINKRTILPTHVKRGPEGLGDAGFGSLTADEWNTVCLILLPLTLVPLWIKKPPQSREKKLLDNFCHLVAALRLAGKRSTSQEIAALFDQHYKEYLHGVKALFPGQHLNPNHHMFGHTPEVLMQYGPVRGWAAWAFEFLNGLAQKIHTNHKEGKSNSIRYMRRSLNHLSGEMERTITEGLCTAALVRGMIVDRTLPDGLGHYYPLWDEAIVGFKAGIYHGNSAFSLSSNLTLGDDWVVPREESKRLTPQALLPSEYQLLAGMFDDLGQKPRDVTRCKTVYCQGRQFSSQIGRESGDGQIQFRTKDDTLAFGEIQSILAIYHWEGGRKGIEGLLAIVEQYVPLAADEQVRQPFAEYPNMEVRMVRKQRQSPEIVDVNRILSHIATCSFNLKLRNDTS